MTDINELYIHSPAPHVSGSFMTMRPFDAPPSWQIEISMSHGGENVHFGWQVANAETGRRIEELWDNRDNADWTTLLSRFVVLLSEKT